MTEKVEQHFDVTTHEKDVRVNAGQLDFLTVKKKSKSEQSKRNWNT
jgi:hypothetical protein